MDNETKINVISHHFDALDRFFDPKLNYRNFVSCGSSRSGKTFQISIYLVLLALDKKHRIVVARFEATTVKESIWQDYLNVISMLGLTDKEVRINKSELTLVFPQTGARIKFTGLNAPEKMKGLASDIVHVDEALDCSLPAINELDQRCTGKMIYSYNPTLTTHFLMDVTAKLPNTVYLHSTFRVNKFIPQAIVDKLESYDPNIQVNIDNGTVDVYRYKVYNLGIPCGLTGCIYTKFTFDQYYQTPDRGNVVYGLDFGMEHVTSLVKVTHFNEKYYCETLLYESQLVINSDDMDDDKTIIRRLEQLNIPKNALIIADCARPEAIEALRRKGYNCHACKKGAGSVLEGIEIIKSCQIVIPQADPLQNETEKYIWKTDAMGRTVQPLKPRKFDDDALDALRYAIVAVAKNPVSNNHNNRQGRGKAIIQRRNQRKRTRR